MVMMKKDIKRNKKNKMISANEIMKRHNMSYQTVNHYTNVGLLPVSVRKGNVRFYSRGLVEKRLKKVAELTKEGYSLCLIRKRLIGV